MSKVHIPFRNAAIVGAHGAVGSLFCSQLATSGCEVTAIDLGEKARPGLNCAQYVCSDACHVNAAAQHVLGAADVVILAVPEEVARNAWAALSRHLSPGALVVDTLSVKSVICEAVRQHGPPGEFLSINPMFAPALGFPGNNVAVVKIKDGLRCASFVELLRTWGCSVTEMTAEKHDRLTAQVQVATHAALLAYGMTLRSMQYDANEAWSIVTPPHRAMLGLLARISAGAPGVYWAIQSQNPHGDNVRHAMAAHLEQLSRIVSAGDFASFKSLLADLKPLLNALPS
jgi:prephenate dehydrogenase